MRSFRPSPRRTSSALPGNMPIGGKYPMVPLNSVVKNIKDLESVPIRTGVYPTVFVRDVGDGGGRLGHRHQLCAGERPAHGLYPGHQALRCLDALGGQPGQAEPGEVPERAAGRREGELRVRPVALRHPGHRGPDAGRRAGRAADGADDPAVPAGLAQRLHRGDQHSPLADGGACWRCGSPGRPSTS